MAAKRKPVQLWMNRDFHGHRPNNGQRSIENLRVDALVILGILWSCRPYSPSELAEIMFLRKSEIVRLLAAIRNSKEQAVLDALAGRFSLVSVVELPKGNKRIVCKRCNQALRVVPCCKCLIDSLHYARKPRRIKGEIPQCKEPTVNLPGSPEKMEVMQTRAQNGFSVFCRGDARICSRARRARN